jgi:hypothetical protein
MAEMFNLIPVATSDVWIALAIFCILALVGLIIFRFLWLKTTDFYFPAEGYEEDDDAYTINGLGEIKMSGLRSYFAALFRRLIWLKPAYWTKYVGFEGNLD